jgi:hypothetical protein
MYFQGIVSLSTMTLSIVTLSKATSTKTHTKSAISMKDTQHNNTQQSVKLRCPYPVLSFFIGIMFSVNVLSVLLLSIIMLSVIKLSVIMLSVAALLSWVPS